MRFSPYAKLAIPAVSVLIIPVGQRASLATFYPAVRITRTQMKLTINQFKHNCHITHITLAHAIFMNFFI